jgi:ABC-type antimicrobial peptide transport system permease subunit
MHVAIRTSSDPMLTASGARSALMRLDSSTPVREIIPLDRRIAESMAPIRIVGGLMLAFGVLALGLSTVGVYGVLSESVAQRAHELGVRLALGAGTKDVLLLVLRQALGLSLAGLAVAFLPVIALSYAMASSLFGIVTLDPGLQVASALLLTGVALLAGYVPARRASRVDPVQILREE